MKKSIMSALAIMAISALTACQPAAASSYEWKTDFTDDTVVVSQVDVETGEVIDSHGFLLDPTAAVGEHTDAASPTEEVQEVVAVADPVGDGQSDDTAGEPVSGDDVVSPPTKEQVVTAWKEFSNAAEPVVKSTWATVSGFVSSMFDAAVEAATNKTSVPDTGDSPATDAPTVPEYSAEEVEPSDVPAPEASADVVAEPVGTPTVEATSDTVTLGVDTPTPDEPVPADTAK